MFGHTWICEGGCGAEIEEGCMPQAHEKEREGWLFINRPGNYALAYCPKCQEKTLQESMPMPLPGMLEGQDFWLIGNAEKSFYKVDSEGNLTRVEAEGECK